MPIGPLPDYVPPAPPAPQTPPPPPQTPQPEPGNVGGTSAVYSAQNGSIQSANLKQLAIPYGRCMIDGRIGPARVASFQMVGAFFYCVGQISGIEKIFIDESGISAWDDGAHGETRGFYFPETQTYEYLRLTQYHGLKTQIVDPTLASFFPGYADDCVYRESAQEVGQVYLVFQQKFGGSKNLVRPRIIVQGLLCWDPRANGGAGDFLYTENPALWIANFITQPYGLGLAVDWSSVTTTANRCDELVGGQPRWWGAAVISDHRNPEAQLERLRAIANCMVRFEGNTGVLVPNAPAASIFTFNRSNIVWNSFDLAYKDQVERPTRIEVAYTERNAGIPWQPKTAIYEPSAGFEPRITSRISLLDASTHEVAYRYAVQEYRLRHVDKWKCRFTARAHAAALTPGDVVTVQHPRLLGSVGVFRIIRVTERASANGTLYDVDLTAYDGSVYSDDDVADPAPQLPTNIDVNDPPMVTNLEAEEVIAPNQAGIVQSRVEINFTPVEWPALSHYRLKLVGPNTSFYWNVEPSALDIFTSSPDLSDDEGIGQAGGQLFTVKVRTVSTSGALSGAARKNVRVFSRYAPPPDISHFTALAHVQGRTFIGIEPVADIGEVKYLVRYSPGIDSGWDLAFPVNDQATDQTTIYHDGFADETNEEIYYYAKAVDNVGNQSVNALKGKVTTDPQLWDEFREVTFEFNETNTVGGERFFFYGEGEFLGSFGKDCTWEKRYGNSASLMRNITLAACDGTGIVDDWPGTLPEGENSAFDLTQEYVRRFSADGRSLALIGTQEIEGFEGVRPKVISTVYPGQTIIGPASGNMTKTFRFGTFVHLPYNFPTPLTEEKYMELALPVLVVGRRIVHDQGGNVTGLTASDLPYNVEFDDYYSATPLLQWTHTSDRSNNIFGIVFLGPTGFEIDRISGGGSVSWGFSWRAVGV